VIEQSAQDCGVSSARGTKTALPFIGRKQHLDLFDQLLQETVAGLPHIVLLQGDAGVGKTRLLKEIQEMATRRALTVCASRCYENLTLPYLPFTESLLPLFGQMSQDIEEECGEDVEFLKQFLHYRSALPPRPANVGVEVRGEQDKLQLFLAVARVILAFTHSRPLLFLLDDLHWADQSSLDLLSHLVFAVADAAVRNAVPCLIIGAYRPVEPEERLARIVARFQREPICQTLELTGFDEAEVMDFLQSLGVSRPSHQLVATVSQATQGNPLFVQEVFHHLAKHEALQERAGYTVTAVSPADLRLPEQVTTAIANRVHSLSENCRKILLTASFLGDRFPLQVLSAVSECSEDELLDLLEEGLQHRLLVNEGQTFQFAHPLIRHVLYSTPSAARRQRMHWQIAQTLEQLYAEHIDAHVLEIAHHLVLAGPVAEVEKVVQYGRQAGDQAFAVFAWGDAARYYEAALSASESTERLSAHDRAALHYRTGFAYYRDMDVGPSLDLYDKALHTYRLTDDLQGVAQVLIAKTRAYLTQASVPYGTLVDVQPLQDTYTAFGDRESQLRGQIAAIMAEAYWHARQTEAARQTARLALEIGQDCKDKWICSYACHVQALAATQTLHLQEALESWQQALTFAQQAEDLWLQSAPLARIPVMLTALGRLEEATAAAVAACDLTKKIHNWAEYSLALATLGAVAVIQGDFAEAERLTREVMRMVRRSHYPWGGVAALFAIACSRALRGAWDEMEDALHILLTPGRVFKEPGPAIQFLAWVYRQLHQAHVGALDEGGKQLAASLVRPMRKGGNDANALAGYCALVEIGDLVDAPPMAEQCYPVLSLAAEHSVVFSPGWVFLLPRVFGVAATLNGWWDQAEAHFSSAIERASSVGARPELARSYLDYARMLMVRGGMGDQSLAGKLLAQARHLFQELGMEPFTQRAIQLAETVQPAVSPILPQRNIPVGHLPLSEIERKLLDAMVKGHTDDDIAEDLVLSPQTVTRLLNGLFSRLEVSGRSAAVTYAVESGLVSHSQSVQQKKAVSGTDLPVRPVSGGDALQSETANIFRREGDYWLLAYQGRVCRLKDAKGLRYLAFLLRYAGREFHATELVTSLSTVQSPLQSTPLASLSADQLAEYQLHVKASNDAGDRLDTQAKAAYKRRLDDLREELAEAQRFNDPARAAKAQAEIDFLTAELAAAVGVGGKSRKAASTTERARLTVTKAIKASLRHIGKNHPPLGQHLTTSIRTGTFCSYLPDPTRPLSWVF
jgi:tetratricopeptide (TPR) repeat protein